MLMISTFPCQLSTPEPVTKRFYTHFKAEFAAFLASIEGIANEAARLDYASLMAKRFMTLFFLQEHKLLDGNADYLSHHLHLAQQSPGNDRFYRDYLLPLFHEQLGQQARPDHLRFGNVPACGLPLFQPHPLEQGSTPLHIPDAAFARLFAFLAAYRWQLVPSPSPTENALGPDILPYIFEQHINQKQMGAYYTKADVSTYIATNTLIPALFTAAARHCPTAFGAEGPLWRLLQAHPDRYILASLRCPDSLPEETSGEFQARRARYERLHTLLCSGVLHAIDDLITANLDLQRLALDLIVSCEQVAAVRAFSAALAEVAILDPTCGSGAFLFAALDILTSLSAACLERLQTLNDPPAHTTLARFEPCPGHPRFILAAIIRNNLYGVDMMEEAVELCRLRLFLALAAHTERARDITPLPALSCNIHVGNALVGFVREQEAEARPSCQPSLNRLLAAHYGIEEGRFAARADYERSLLHWEQTHRPFHWFAAFPEVMRRGGFDVILGNPPYIEYSKVRQAYTMPEYEHASCGNLYAAVIERSLALCRPAHSYLGLVVPLSICGGERFARLRRTITDATQRLWLANFEIFPSRLFDGAFQRLSLLIARQGSQQRCALHVTRIQRWYAAERPHIINLITYTPVRRSVRPGVFPKLAAPLQEEILHKVLARSGNNCIAQVLSPRRTEHFVYYQEATNYWTKAACHLPFYKRNGVVMEPPHGRLLFLRDEAAARTIMALLNSSLFYLWFATYSDGFHLSHTLVKEFPLRDDLGALQALVTLSRKLEDDVWLHTQRSTRNTRQQNTDLLIELEEFRMGRSRALLDEIDCVLAQYYGLTGEELAFILQYDQKYRMGKG